MKKFVSILLTMAMLVTMVPIIAATATVDTAAATTGGKWTDSGNYDISWCQTKTEAINGTGNDNQTTEINGTLYYFIGWDSAKEYTIDSAAKLAGLAYLTNYTTSDCFQGSVFNITADIDLSAHEWVPMAFTQGKFRGSLVGQKGGVDGTAVTISNMTVNSTDTNGRSGLVGKFGGGDIKNINLVNASITAAAFTVGSFVGWQDGNISGGYSNLSSDATIVVTGSRGDRYDDVGGIVGISNNGYIATGYKNCVFTGTIDAPYADLVGGIMGTYEETQGTTSGKADLLFENCVVVSDYIKVGKGSHYLSGNSEVDSGYGGIIGRCTIDEADANGVIHKLEFKNCYVAADIMVYDSETAVQNRNVAGFIGNIWGCTTNITNCQFDGTVSGNAQRVGSMVGRTMNTNDLPLTYTDCVVTGIAFNGNDPEKLGFIQNAYTWNGRATIAGNWTITDCYTGLSQMVASGVNTVPTVITADTELSGLDMTDTWTKVDGSNYPILKIALPYYNAENSPSIVNAGLDFSWVSFESGTMSLDDPEYYDELACLLDVVGAKYEDTVLAKYTVPMHLGASDLSGLDSRLMAVINEKLNVSGGFVNDKIVSMEFVQKAIYANSEGKYNVRLTAKVKGTQYSGITFKYEIKTVSNGATTYGEIVETDAVKTLHTSVIENLGDSQNTITAEEGYYFVVFIIENVDIDNADELSVAARACAKPLEGKPMYSKIAAHTIKAQ